MLTVDLVQAYPRDGRLSLRQLRPHEKQLALDLSERYIALIRACVGKTRAELDEQLDSVDVPARFRRKAQGLRKLLADRCNFEVEEGHDPVALRREVFECAATQRRELGPGETLSREAVLAEVANAHAIKPADVDRLLYVDLRSAHRLLEFTAPGPPPERAGELSLGAQRLVEEYVTGQAQAVLLRAVSVQAHVYSPTPEIYRALFHKLKFLQLLVRIERGRPRSEFGEPTDEHGYTLYIDGPFSLFRSVTKYGLKLALLLPMLQACDQWAIEAEVAWGKSKEQVTFALSGTGPGIQDASDDDDGSDDDESTSLLQPAVATLLKRFKSHDSAWAPIPSQEILNLPGTGLCVPDLVFIHNETGECVYFEVLGFWSREAVWRRVELVQAGLPQPILFAVSNRLRVSQAVLGDDLPGALYVYKGVMTPRAICTHLDRLVGQE